MKKALGLFAALATASFGGDYSTWGYYREVTVSTTGLGLAGNVTNVPLLVRFRAADHSDLLNNAGTQMLSNGDDIRVTKSDGTTDVPFEIDTASTGAAGVLYLWILADNVLQNSSSAATFRVYWKKTGAASMSDSSAVFNASNGYQAVYHFKQARPTTDATNNGYTLTSGGTVNNNTAPLIGDARTFGTATGNVNNATTTSAVHAFFNAPSGALGTNGAIGALTISAWTRSSVTSTGNRAGGEKHVLYHGAGNGSATNHVFLKRWGVAGGGLGSDNYAGGNRWIAGGDTAVSDSTVDRGPYVSFGEGGATIDHWIFVAAVWNGTNWVTYKQRRWENWNAAKIGARATPDNGPTYMGGTGGGANGGDSAVQFDTSAVAGAPIIDNTKSWFIGGWETDGVGGTATEARRIWQGQLDEVRIENAARSYDYLKLRFLAERDTVGSLTNTLYTIGGGQATPIVPGGAPKEGFFAAKSVGEGVSFQLSGQEAGTIIVSDLQGRTVWSREVAANDRSIAWNSASAGKGVYFARFLSRNASNVVYPQARFSLVK